MITNMFNKIKNFFFPRNLLKEPLVENKEKAIEYQQVAGLVCMDLDLLNDLANSSDSLEDLKYHVNFYHARKNVYISDKKEREQQYALTQMLFSLPVTRTHIR